MHDVRLSVVELAPVLPATSDDCRCTACNDAAKAIDRQLESGADRQISVLRDRHRTMICVAIFIIAASFLLQLSGTERLTFSWSQVELPTLCPSRALFGVECPG